MALECLCLIVDCEKDAAVELSVWIVMEGWGYPIYVRVVRSGTKFWVLVTISASTANAITVFII